MSSDSQNSPAMSDLEWLARNVSEWQGNSDCVYRMADCAFFYKGEVPVPPRAYTRAQWAAERQRLGLDSQTCSDCSATLSESEVNFLDGNCEACEKKYSYSEELQEPDSQKWNGEGLPPVGCECEAKHKRDETWLRHAVLGVGHSYIFSRLLPGQTEDGEQVGGEGLLHIDNYDFRPTRTPEEVEREELIEIILSHGNLSEGMLADAIMADGFRKPGAQS